VTDKIHGPDIQPMLSFIIPAHNEEQLLSRTIGSIHTSAAESGEPYEIIVADDASTDATAEIARQHGARIVQVDHRQISKTRNSGAAEATGDILIFVDADTTINSEVLQAVLKKILAGAVGGGAAITFDGKLPLYGRLLNAPFQFLFQRVSRLAYGCFIFCTRQAFEATGGFDEELFASEEINFSMALRREGKFVLLREPVMTSGRKLRTYSFWEALGLLLSFMIGGPSSMKSRDKLDLWYGPRREDVQAGAVNDDKQTGES
jgi:glycosyltransferase involved in cell wall biosynthesis